MRTRRLHVTGASGAGVTTLGRALADALACPHHDTDDYFWLPTAPPYQDQRPVPDRLRLMEAVFLPRSDWVLSGSLDGWGDALIPQLDVVVFLYVPPEIRMQRLRARELRRGWRQGETDDFLEWASHYDDGTREGRNLARHTAWLARLPCQVLRMDGTLPVVELVDRVVAALPE